MNVMSRREMVRCAVALGGGILLGSRSQAAPRPKPKPGPIPGWSCEFKLLDSEATSLILNGEFWCRHVSKDLGYTWVLPDGELTIPLPDKFRYVKELTVVGVSSPWGKASLVRFCWNGIIKEKMEFRKEEERSFHH